MRAQQDTANHVSLSIYSIVKEPMQTSFHLGRLTRLQFGQQIKHQVLSSE